MKTTDFTNIDDSEAFTTLFAENLKKHVLGGLEDSEELSESPASMIALITSSIGNLNTKQFYEYLIHKNEAFPKQALIKRNLLRQLDSKTVGEIYAKPAMITFIVGFKKKDLIKYGIPVINQNIKKLRLGKNTRMRMVDGPIFRPLENIDIVMNEFYNNNVLVSHSFFAKYTTDNTIKSKIMTFNNPYIKSSNLVYEGDEYFLMHIPFYNYETIENEYYVNNNDKKMVYDINVSDKKVIGFDVIYTSKQGSQILLNGELDGVDSLGYNYTLEEFNGTKKLKITFNKRQSSSYFWPGRGSKILVKVYTSNGVDGNFQIPNVEENVDGLNIYMSQEIGDIYQEPLIKIKPLVSVTESEATGGRDELSMEEIRGLATDTISNSTIITQGEIDNIATKYDFVSKKIRSDIYAIEYFFYSVLKYDGYILPTRNTDIVFNENDPKIIKNSTITSLIISPSIKYKMDELNRMVIADDSEEDTFIFPFHILLKNSEYIRRHVYNTYINEFLNLDFKFYNEDISYKANITNMKIYRNPISSTISPVSGAKYANTYRLSFDIEVADEFYNRIRDYYDVNMDNPNVLRTPLYDIDAGFNVVVILKDTISGNEFRIKNDIIVVDFLTTFGNDGKKNTIRVGTILNTTTIENGVDENNVVFDSYGSIMIRNYCLESLPFDNSSYREGYLLNNVVIKAYTAFKMSEGRSGSRYDNVLHEGEKALDYDISTAFESNEIQLSKDITKYFHNIIDMNVTPRVYDVYTENVPMLYENDVYVIDDDGNIVFNEQTVTLPNGTTSIVEIPTILHRAGDPVLKEDGTPIYSHTVGEKKLNELGDPIILEDKSAIYTITNIPLMDSIFINDSNLTLDDESNVLRMYENIFTRLDIISGDLPDKCKVRFSFKNTTGIGNVIYDHPITGEKSPLNDISLSIRLGIKLTGNNELPFSYYEDLVIKSVIEYVNNIEQEVISPNHLCKYITTSIPNIEYAEWYSINDIPVGNIRTLYYNEDFDKDTEKLNIKALPDENGDLKPQVFVTEILN